MCSGIDFSKNFTFHDTEMRALGMEMLTITVSLENPGDRKKVPRWHQKSPQRIDTTDSFRRS